MRSSASSSDVQPSSFTSCCASAQVGKWTCASLRPGTTTRPPRSTTSGDASAVSGTPTPPAIEAPAIASARWVGTWGSCVRMSPLSRITSRENVRVFDHVDIHVADLAESRRFYFEALGLPTSDGEHVAWGDFGIDGCSPEHPLTRRLHIAFGAEDRDGVDAWWTRMTEAGYESDGEPGPRPQYSPDYYGAFVLDPDGNSVEAVNHGRSRAGEIDHLWLRARDVDAIARFYETVAPVVAISVERRGPDFAHIRFGDGSG